MTMHLKAAPMIKSDFITIKGALGATAKSAMILLLRNGSVKKKDGWGRSKHAASIEKTHTNLTILVLSTIALFFDAYNIKKLLY